MIISSGIVYTSPQILQNGVTSLKTHPTFSVQTKPEKFENATISLDLFFEENLGKHMIIVTLSVSKSSVLTMCFLPVFKLLRFEGSFRKAPFP